MSKRNRPEFTVKEAFDEAHRLAEAADLPVGDNTVHDEMVHLADVAEADVNGLLVKNKEYGGSWKRRGGVGAFMMLARKWDRLEEQVKSKGYDVFQAVAEDGRSEGVIDDIRDLRRYLMLVESYLIAGGVVE